MFVLRAFRLDNSPVPAERYRFSTLPIRIGRNPLNDFSPQHGLISAFHARIEDHDGKLCIRDLSSKNGVFLPGGPGGKPVRVEPDTDVELAPSGYRFYLGPRVVVQLELPQEQAPLRGSATHGSVLGNLAMLAQPGGAIGGQPLHPLGAGPVASPPFPPAGPAPAAGGSSPPAERGQPRTQFFKMELESMALLGLRELSGSLIPGRPLETTGDVARLITKLHDTVDVLCRCFVPLRQGYAQFVSSLDLQRAALQRSVNRSPAALALETAARAEEVAMALLDPREHSFDAPAAVEGIFADLMLHQIALLDGVMQGVRALLEELSPEQIDRALSERGFAGRFGNKYRERWTEFCERFERLSEERQAFAVIFGRDFAEVYRQYWQRRQDAEEQGLRTDPPRG